MADAHTGDHPRNASDVPLEADGFPMLVRIPCDVDGCQRESWTSIPIAGLHGRVTLCSIHRSRLQLVLYRFLGLDDANERWREWDQRLAKEVWTEGRIHTSEIAAVNNAPWNVSDPREWLCSRCGKGMAFQAGVSFGMHKCGEAV